MVAKLFSLVSLMICPLQQGWTQADFRTDYFRAPLDIEMLLSGNFGELRSNHFHSGIDIKTRGVTGHRVFAAADGYVSRIKVEAAGYGNTLYITHPGGYTTVYAHLESFRSDISGYVRDRQYQAQQHAMNIFPGQQEWPVKKGDMIAFSGTSGYSFGPHLHFEIRDANYQVPMNALLFGFDIKDDKAPRILSLYTYPGNRSSIVNGSSDKTRLEIIQVNGTYRLAGGDTIVADGIAGFGIEAFDYLNGANNRCGIYRIRMLVDGELKYEWKMDRFPFSHARYLNSYIDYEEKIRNNKLVQKAFVDPNNKLELYRNVKNAGWIDFSEARNYPVKFILEDSYQNPSILEFSVAGGTSGSEDGDLAEDANEMHTTMKFAWPEKNEFSADGIILKIPEKALYRDLEFIYVKSEALSGAYSGLHSVHDPHTPIHLACELGIRPGGLPEELYSKALIGTVDEDGELGSAGGEWKDSMVWTQIREFGNYTVIIDTTPPRIKPLNPPDPNQAISGKSVRFRVTDEISGIKSYEGYIDNNWVLFEYDAKNDLVYYRFDPGRLTSGQNHELELYITDNKENIAYYYTEFYW